MSVTGVADGLLAHAVIKVAVQTINYQMATKLWFFHVTTIIFFKVMKFILKSKLSCGGREWMERN